MWTATALAREARPAEGLIWRAVEDQTAAATRKLVSTSAKQDLLEQMLEESKPPVPATAGGLHYLLFSPFRYEAPFPTGSRFRPPGPSAGVFYGSEAVRTALAEISHYRLRFFQDSPDTPLPRREERLTVFSVSYASARGIDLTQAPFAAQAELWTDPDDYGPTQALAENARQAGVEVIRYASVRDPEGGFNVALLEPSAFAEREPREFQHWSLYLAAEEADCRRIDGAERWVFTRAALAGGAA